jgi:hypothetical protein
MHTKRNIVTLSLVLLGVGLVLGGGMALAGEPQPDGKRAPPSPPLVVAEPLQPAASPQLGSPPAPAAACSGGPIIDGVTLDECVVNNFTVGGNPRSITVWYTQNTATATRIVDGNPVVLEHWITADAQAQDVADWAEEAWQRYFADSGHEPFHDGCSNNLNIQLEDGVGWAGIAYWAYSGTCNIGIDSPTIRNGGGQRTVYHEVQHYQQYSYNAGCYASWKPNYPNNAEFVEGYADLGSNSVDATIDANYQVGSYNPHQSMYDEGYSNLFTHYWTQQLGTLGTPAEPRYHIDPMYEHYEECDVQDTLYVLDTVIPALSGGSLSKKDLFLNFFAANWARNWADPGTQPELVYSDADDNSFNDPTLTQNVSMSGGSQNWAGTTPDDWAARYYQVTPQSGCPYVEIEVDGAGGADLGINLMAADTAAPTVLRSAWIGEDFARTFAGHGVYNRVVAIVNSFQNNYGYDVSFTCVTPAINILEPRQVGFALVGAPDSPIAFLARFEVTSGGQPVRGIDESSLTYDAEGDAITVVPGSFQEVAPGQYWVVLLPPTKPAGTAFVDLKVCLDTTICDTETHALLYVDPGNSDVALVFDASGSMDEEDVPGEGKRYILAQRAGKVEADLLRNGDRILVTDFSAKDNPTSCGLPWGLGDCELDLKTLLARTDVTGPATITDTKDAIDLVSPRDWTPIGEALVDAKDKLKAAPTNSNPKHIFLLSDGEENVNRLYADVKAELIASGVVINTIGFGPDAPGALLAQIAAETGGTYRPVPTQPGTMLGTPDAQLRREKVVALGVPEAMVEPMAADPLPGQLGLADVYEDFDTQAQDATRVFHVNALAVPNNTPKEYSGLVDESVNQLRFVVAGRQPDGELHDICDGYHRRVDILPPEAGPRECVPISPINTQDPPPANWDIRNELYDDVLIVSNPQPGLWTIRVKYFYQTCPASGTAETPLDPAALESDFMVNMSVQSTIQLEGRLLGLTNNQGKAGDRVSIVATLLQRTGTLPGAVVDAIIDKPGATDAVWLFDDGEHGDGGAGDGIYGNDYSLTTVGGSYNVKLVADFEDPKSPGTFLHREWNGGFWIDGPELDDPDHDGMPSDWERRCDLDPYQPDAKGDPDHDDLSNIDEFYNGTVPCDPDTDDGGENDGSEVEFGRDPLQPHDDQVAPLGVVTFRPLNGMIVVGWTRPISYTRMLLFVSTEEGELGEPRGMDATGVYTVTRLANDQPYFLRVVGMNDDAVGPPSQPQAVIPKADPDPPSGWILINNGEESTASPQVLLFISSSDTPPDGAIQGANAHMTDRVSQAVNEVTGDVEMRISNEPSMEGGEWEPLAAHREWALDCGVGEYCTVFAQFRDGAENESLIVSDDILREAAQLFLPLILKP